MVNLPPIPPRKKPRPAYKKPEAVRELEQLADEQARRDHPSMRPEHLAPRKYRDDTANGLTKCINHYLKLKGAFSSRVNNQGVYRDGRYTRSTARRGLPDILATYKGKSLFIEIKIGKDAMSQHQKQVQQEQQASGGVYYVARNFTDFKQWFDEL